MGGGPLLAPAHLARGAAAIGDGRNGDAYEYLWPIFDESAPAFHRFMRWSGLLDSRGRRHERTSSTPSATVIAELDGSRFAVTDRFSRRLASATPLVASMRRHKPLRGGNHHRFEGVSVSAARTLFSLVAGSAGSDVAPTHGFRFARRSHCSTRSVRALGRTGEAGASGHRREARPTHARRPRSPDRARASDSRACGCGLTNREIGERMFLSHRTIGSHLYRIFPKLDISSRAQLRDAPRGGARGRRNSRLTEEKLAVEGHDS